MTLKSLKLGCHVGMEFAGAYGYADDVALIAPTLVALKEMIKVSESYAKSYHITFNPKKSKLICYNCDVSNVPNVYLNDVSVPIAEHDKHLGNYISTNVYDRNITGHIIDLYQRSNNVINDFIACDSGTIDSLHTTFCMHMYGSELWNLSDGSTEKFKIAWRKVKRRIWKLPCTAHKHIVHNLTSDLNALLEKRLFKFMYNALNHKRLCKNILLEKLQCKNSTFAENFRFLSYKYQLEYSDWFHELSHLMGKVKMKATELYSKPPEAICVKELCEMRDYAYTEHLNKCEITKLINSVCTE